jgi:sugar-specific transcriptional regulator TrmB
MDTSILGDLGLSKGEITAYIALLQLGQTKVGAIIEKSGMASSAVHNAINTLTEKGLVSHIKKGKIKYYSAAQPKQIANFIQEKKEKFLEILPELELKAKKEEDKQDAEIFEGIKGILTILNELIEDAKKGDKYLFFATYITNKEKEIQEFFERYDIKRERKGLNIKGLAPLELKPLFVKRKMLHMKYPKFPIPADTSICNNKIALISWGEKPVGYLIKSKELAEKYSVFFDQAWDSC